MLLAEIGTGDKIWVCCIVSIDMVHFEGAEDISGWGTC